MRTRRDPLQGAVRTRRDPRHTQYATYQTSAVSAAAALSTALLSLSFPRIQAAHAVQRVGQREQPSLYSIPWQAFPNM